ncbi:ABC transporter substrate-binding protein [Candidatus Dependentiae bacterium]|nr:ABC transporter substrate-binding protein [Candidatus Dependentiae bacterium]
MRNIIYTIITVIILIPQIIFAEVGVTDNEILIGSSLVLEGPAKFLGVQTKIGYETYIKKINEEGGVNGRKIKTIFYNDNYEPTPCAENTKKLIEDDKVFALTSYVGTPTTKIIVPMINQNKIPLIGCFTGAETFRNPLEKYILNIRASYNMECAEIINYFVDKLKLSKIAVFYQNDAYGLAGLQGTIKALKEKKMALCAKASYERNTLDVKEALSALKESQPEAIIMIGVYAPCAEFIKLAKKEGLKTYFHNVSFVGPDKFLETLGSDGDGVIVTQVVPLYHTPLSDFAVNELYLKDLKKYFPEEKPTSVSYEGYLNALILVEGLKRAGKELTREKLIESIESIKPGQLGTGIKISFSDSDHQGSDRVFVTRIEKGKYVCMCNEVK